MFYQIKVAFSVNLFKQPESLISQKKKKKKKNLEEIKGQMHSNSTQHCYLRYDSALYRTIGNLTHTQALTLRVMSAQRRKLIPL